MKNKSVMTSPASQRAPSGPGRIRRVGEALKVGANYAVSGERGLGPFDVPPRTPRRPRQPVAELTQRQKQQIDQFSQGSPDALVDMEQAMLSDEASLSAAVAERTVHRQARAGRIRRGMATIALTGVAVAGAAGVGVVGKMMWDKYKSDAKAHAAATQADLRKTIRPAMISLDKQILAAQAQHPENFHTTPVGDGAVRVTDLALGKANQPTFAVMGTYQSGPHEGQPNANDPRFFESTVETPGNGVPMVGQRTVFALAAPKGEAYAAENQYFGGAAGTWYATEAPGVDETGNDLWYTMNQVATDRPANNGFGESTLANGNPDTPSNRAGQVIDDLGIYVGESGIQQF